VTDEALMRAVRDGDLDRLGVLFERHHRSLFGFFYRMRGDRAAAEDLVQDVFVRVLKYRRSFQERGSFEAWLFQIARNARRDRARRDPAMDSLPEELDIAGDAPGPDIRVEQEEDIVLLNEALRRLPAEKRELIVLSRYQGMTYEELAELMEADVGTVRVQLHRAIRQLADIFCGLRGERAS
jgi:RNA polymerase sigma factor (sigma-70 family)